MGSSGQKRKGRKHLPKVGTPQEMAWEEHERRAEALHPFSADPGRRRTTGFSIAAVAVAAVVIIAAFILIFIG